MKSLETLLHSIREKLSKLENSDMFRFQDFVNSQGKPLRGVLNYVGVYIIYEGDKPIYVGSAGKGNHMLRYRLADLFDQTTSKGEVKYYHTLTRKLLLGKGKQKFTNLDEVKSFYREKCSVKIIKTQDIDEAKAVEHVLIKILRNEGTLLNS